MKKYLLLLLIVLCLPAKGQFWKNTNLSFSIPPNPASASQIWVGLIVGNYMICSNGDSLLITGKDFDAQYLPYKSACFISQTGKWKKATVKDTNNFWFSAVDSSPNLIPVIALHQNGDYANRRYSKHIAQVLDTNGVEISEPKITQIVNYKSEQKGNDSVLCAEYFEVPTKATSNVRLVPGQYATIQLAINAAATNDVIYVSTITDAYTTNYLNVNKTITIKGIGNVKVTTTTGTYELLVSNAPTIEGIDFQTSAKQYAFLSGSSGAAPTLRRCKLSEVAIFNNANAFNSITIDNCIIARTNNKMTGAFPACTIKNSYLKNIQWLFDTYDMSFNYNKVICDYAGDYAIPINNNFAAGLGTWDRVFNNNFISTADQTSVFILAKNKHFDIRYNKFSSTTQKNWEHVQILVDGNVDVSTGNKLSYNISTSNSLNGCVLNIGNELAYTNVISGTEVIGNYIRGSYYNYSSTSTMLHGILVTCGVNNIIKYNLSTYCRYGLVIKTGSPVQAYTSGGAWSNLFYNNSEAIYCRGVGGIKLYNNTNFCNVSGRFYTSWHASSNTVVPGDNQSVNIIIKNNVSYTSTDGAANNYHILFEDTETNTDTANNNLVFGGQHLVRAWNVNYDNLATAQVAGWLLNSLNQNPNLKSTTQLWATTAITTNAATLSAPYNVGLDTTTNWGSSYPVIVTKTGTTQMGAYIK